MRDCKHGRLARSCNECLLEVELQETKAQLAEAEKVVSFYENIQQWDGDEIMGDTELYFMPHCESRDIGGKTARAYFTNKESE